MPNYYVVKPGDSWAKIAGKVYGNQRMLGVLQKSNPTTGGLHPGMRIKLPGNQKNPYVSEADLRGDRVASRGKPSFTSPVGSLASPAEGMVESQLGIAGGFSGDAFARALAAEDARIKKEAEEPTIPLAPSGGSAGTYENIQKLRDRAKQLTSPGGVSAVGGRAGAEEEVKKQLDALKAQTHPVNRDKGLKDDVYEWEQKLEAAWPVSTGGDVYVTPTGVFTDQESKLLESMEVAGKPPGIIQNKPLYIDPVTGMLTMENPNPSGPIGANRAVFLEPENIYQAGRPFGTRKEYEEWSAQMRADPLMSPAVRDYASIVQSEAAQQVMHRPLYETYYIRAPKGGLITKKRVQLDADGNPMFETVPVEPRMMKTGEYDYTQRAGGRGGGMLPVPRTEPVPSYTEIPFIDPQGNVSWANPTTSFVENITTSAVQFGSEFFKTIMGDSPKTNYQLDTFRSGMALAGNVLLDHFLRPSVFQMRPMYRSRIDGTVLNPAQALEMINSGAGALVEESPGYLIRAVSRAQARGQFEASKFLFTYHEKFDTVDEAKEEAEAFGEAVFRHELANRLLLAGQMMGVDAKADMEARGFDLDLLNKVYAESIDEVNLWDAFFDPNPVKFKDLAFLDHEGVLDPMTYDRQMKLREYAPTLETALRTGDERYKEYRLEGEKQQWLTPQEELQYLIYGYDSLSANAKEAITQQEELNAAYGVVMDTMDARSDFQYLIPGGDPYATAKAPKSYGGATESATMTYIMADLVKNQDKLTFRMTEAVQANRLEEAYAFARRWIDLDKYMDINHNRYWAYSFHITPEREEWFIHNVALAMMHKGGPLNVNEFLSIKNRMVDWKQELPGEVLFDLYNGIDLLQVAFGPIGGLSGAATKAIMTLPVVGKIAVRVGPKIASIAGKVWQAIPMPNVARRFIKFMGDRTARSAGREAGGQFLDVMTGVRSLVTHVLPEGDEALGALSKQTNLKAILYQISQALSGPAITAETATAKLPKGITNSPRSLQSLARLASNFSEHVIDNLDNLVKEGKITARNADIIRNLDIRNWHNLPEQVAARILNSEESAQRAAYRILQENPRLQATILAGEGGEELLAEMVNARLLEEARDVDKVVDLMVDMFEQGIVAFHRPTDSWNLYDTSMLWQIWDKGTSFLESFFSYSKPKQIPSTLLNTVSGLNSLKNFWVRSVLHWRPAWVIRNFIDTGYRLLTYMDNGALLRSPFISIQQMSQDLTNQEMIYLARLLTPFTDEKNEHANRIIERMMNGEKFNWFWPGEYWKARIELMDSDIHEKSLIGKLSSIATSSVTGAFGGTISDAQSTLEFVMRLRMFHNEYFKITTKLDKVKLARAIQFMTEAGVSPQGIKQVIAAWKKAGNNPDQFAELFLQVRGAVYGADRVDWGLFFDPKSLMAFGDLDEPSKMTVVRSLQEQITERLQYLRQMTDKELQVADIMAMVTDVKDNLRFQIFWMLENGPNANLQAAAGMFQPGIQPFLMQELGVDKVNGHTVYLLFRPEDSAIDYVYKDGTPAYGYNGGTLQDMDTGYTHPFLADVEEAKPKKPSAATIASRKVTELMNNQAYYMAAASRSGRLEDIIDAYAHEPDKPLKRIAIELNLTDLFSGTKAEKEDRAVEMIKAVLLNQGVPTRKTKAFDTWQAKRLSTYAERQGFYTSVTVYDPAVPQNASFPVIRAPAEGTGVRVSASVDLSTELFDSIEEARGFGIFVASENNVLPHIEHVAIEQVAGRFYPKLYFYNGSEAKLPQMIYMSKNATAYSQTVRSTKALGDIEASNLPQWMIPNRHAPDTIITAEGRSFASADDAKIFLSNHHDELSTPEKLSIINIIHSYELNERTPVKGKVFTHGGATSEQFAPRRAESAVANSLIDEVDEIKRDDMFDQRAAESQYNELRQAEAGIRNESLMSGRGQRNPDKQSLQQRIKNNLDKLGGKKPPKYESGGQLDNIHNEIDRSVMKFLEVQENLETLPGTPKQVATRRKYIDSASRSADLATKRINSFVLRHFPGPLIDGGVPSSALIKQLWSDAISIRLVLNRNYRRWLDEIVTVGEQLEAGATWLDLPWAHVASRFGIQHVFSDDGALVAVKFPRADGTHLMLTGMSDQLNAYMVSIYGTHWQKVAEHYGMTHKELMTMLGWNGNLRRQLDVGLEELPGALASIPTPRHAIPLPEYGYGAIQPIQVGDRYVASRADQLIPYGQRFVVREVRGDTVNVQFIDPAGKDTRVRLNGSDRLQSRYTINKKDLAFYDGDSEGRRIRGRASASIKEITADADAARLRKQGYRNSVIDRLRLPTPVGYRTTVPGYGLYGFTIPKPKSGTTFVTNGLESFDESAQSRIAFILNHLPERDRTLVARNGVAFVNNNELLRVTASPEGRAMLESVRRDVIVLTAPGMPQNRVIVVGDEALGILSDDTIRAKLGHEFNHTQLSLGNLPPQYVKQGTSIAVADANAFEKANPGAYRKMFNLLGLGNVDDGVYSHVNFQSYFFKMMAGQHPDTPEVLDALIRHFVEIGKIPEGQLNQATVDAVLNYMANALFMQVGNSRGYVFDAKGATAEIVAELMGPLADKRMARAFEYLDGVDEISESIEGLALSYGRGFDAYHVTQRLLQGDMELPKSVEELDRILEAYGLTNIRTAVNDFTTLQDAIEWQDELYAILKQADREKNRLDRALARNSQGEQINRLLRAREEGLAVEARQISAGLYATGERAVRRLSLTDVRYASQVAAESVGAVISGAGGAESVTIFEAVKSRASLYDYVMDNLLIEHYNRANDALASRTLEGPGRIVAQNTRNSMESQLVSHRMQMLSKDAATVYEPSSLFTEDYTNNLAIVLNDEQFIRTLNSFSGKEVEGPIYSADEFKMMVREAMSDAENDAFNFYLSDTYAKNYLANQSLEYLETNSDLIRQDLDLLESKQLADKVRSEYGIDLEPGEFLFDRETELTYVVPPGSSKTPSQVVEEVRDIRRELPRNSGLEVYYRPVTPESVDEFVNAELVPLMRPHTDIEFQSINPRVRASYLTALLAETNSLEMEVRTMAAARGLAIPKWLRDSFDIMEEGYLFSDRDMLNVFRQASSAMMTEGLQPGASEEIKAVQEALHQRAMSRMIYGHGRTYGTDELTYRILSSNQTQYADQFIRKNLGMPTVYYKDSGKAFDHSIFREIDDADASFGYYASATYLPQDAPRYNLDIEPDNSNNLLTTYGFATLGATDKTSTINRRWMQARRNAAFVAFTPKGPKKTRDLTEALFRNFSMFDVSLRGNVHKAHIQFAQELNRMAKHLSVGDIKQLDPIFGDIWDSAIGHLEQRLGVASRTGVNYGQTHAWSTSFSTIPLSSSSELRTSIPIVPDELAHAERAETWLGTLKSEAQRLGLIDDRGYVIAQEGETLYRFPLGKVGGRKAYAGPSLDFHDLVSKSLATLRNGPDTARMSNAERIMTDRMADVVLDMLTNGYWDTVNPLDGKPKIQMIFPPSPYVTANLGFQERAVGAASVWRALDLNDWDAREVQFAGRIGDVFEDFESAGLGADDASISQWVRTVYNKPKEGRRKRVLSLAEIWYARTGLQRELDTYTRMLELLQQQSLSARTPIENMALYINAVEKTEEELKLLDAIAKNTRYTLAYDEAGQVIPKKGHKAVPLTEDELWREAENAYKSRATSLPSVGTAAPPVRGRPSRLPHGTYRYQQEAIDELKTLSDIQGGELLSEEEALRRFRKYNPDQNVNRRLKIMGDIDEDTIAVRDEWLRLQENEERAEELRKEMILRGVDTRVADKKASQQAIEEAEAKARFEYGYLEQATVPHEDVGPPPIGVSGRTISGKSMDVDKQYKSAYEWYPEEHKPKPVKEDQAKVVKRQQSMDEVDREMRALDAANTEVWKKSREAKARWLAEQMKKTWEDARLRYRELVPTGGSPRQEIVWDRAEHAWYVTLDGEDVRLTEPLNPDEHIEEITRTKRYWASPTYQPSVYLDKTGREWNPTTDMFKSLRDEMAEEQNEFWNTFLRAKIDGQQSILDMFNGIRYGDHDILESPENLTRYLNRRIRHLINEGASDETINHLRSLKYNVETARQFQLGRAQRYGYASFEEGSNLPPFPFWEMPESMRAALSKSDNLEKMWGEISQGMDAMLDGMLKESNQVLFKPMLAEDSDKLAKLQDAIIREKAAVKDIALHGTDWDDALEGSYRGAYNIVGDYMIDYDKVYNIDNIFKMMYPFWMFPSRSIPFWTKTLIDHPELAIFYYKYLNSVDRYQYEQRLVNSRGQTLKSKRGYIKIPGTNIWFNPIAPLSIRYVFEAVDLLASSRNHNNYNDEYSQRQNIWGQTAEYIYNMSRAMGLDVPPWMYPLLSLTTSQDPTWRFGSPWPMVPLLPKFWYKHMLGLMRGITDVSALGDKQVRDTMGRTLWKDTSYDDILYENAAYAIVLERLNATDDEVEKQQIINEMHDALGYNAFDLEQGQIKRPREDSALWIEAVKRADNSRALLNMAGYMFGVYGQPYTTADANMYMIQRQRNTLKNAINDHVLAFAIGADESPLVRYQKYIDFLNTDEAFIGNLLWNVRWEDVDNSFSAGADQNDRREAIALQVTREIQTKEYYAEIGRLRDQNQKLIKALGIGASFEQRNYYYEKLQDDILALRTDPKYSLVSYTSYYNVGNKPLTMVYSDIEDELWRMVNLTKPEFDSYGDWEQYDAAVKKWETEELPRAIQSVSEKFISLPERVLYNLSTNGSNMQSAVLDAGYDWDMLISKWASEANLEAYKNWQTGRMSMFDAMAKGYAELYSNKYYETEGMSPAAKELFRRNFDTIVPIPSAADLVNWVQTNFPGRFSSEEMLEALADDANIMSMKQSFEQGQDEFDKQNDEIYRILGSLGPSYGPLYDKFIDAFKKRGGDESDIDTHYTMEGAWANNADGSVRASWIDFHTKMKLAAQDINLRPSTDGELIEYDQAWKSNQEFKRQAQIKFGENILDVMSLYGQSNTADRKKMRAANKNITAYYDFKDEFAEAYQIWAKYYWPSKYKGEAGLPNVPGIEEAQPTASYGYGGYSGGYGSPSGSSGGGSGGGKNAPSVSPFATPMGRRSSTNPFLLGEPGELGKGGTVPWPRGS